MDRLKIAFITPEAIPYAKTGGLADISGVLPEILAGMGHDVKLILPRYRQIATGFPNLKKTTTGIGCRIKNEIYNADIYTLRDETSKVEIVFISNDFFFNRQELYLEPSTGRDYEDNDDRFIFFCRIALKYLHQSGWQPDIYHAHDWQAALIPSLVKTRYSYDSFFNQSGTVFTVHNLAYQGIFPPATFDKLGIAPELFAPAAPFEYWGKVNLMKSAIVLSDMVTTVSPTYAREIQDTNEYGMGLEGVLKDRSADLVGILNGADYQNWSPKKDKLIPFKYFKDNLSGKKKNKLELLHRCSFPLRTEQPLIGMISRLDNQKGFDILSEIINDVLKMDIQMVLLGTGERKYHVMFNELTARYPDKFHAFLQFDNQLAHLIEAGSDIFLMPSRYEPCGLNKMYSLRYGTVPIVRKTGGLADTVEDVNDTTGDGTGFMFDEYSSAALMSAIKRAVMMFEKKRLWYKIVKRGMVRDFSWKKSAGQYLEVYNRALTKLAR